MSLINLSNACLSFGGPPVFDEISLTVEQGEKIALVGINGSGKSTLLKVIAGLQPVDSGVIAFQKGIRTAYLDQMVPGDMPGTVAEVVKGGLNGNTPENDRHDSLDLRAEKAISQIGLDAASVFNTLSAGMKRKVLLAKALACQPDVLLLDEPTNHMDIDSIKRLEQILMKFTGALILVTHDRVFLQKIATRIIEIDRGRLFGQACDYETFLERRDAQLAVEDVHNALFDKKLKKEEQWIRTGVRARRTRNEGRVRELEKLRAMRRERRERTGTVKFASQEMERSGSLVIRARNVSFSYGDRTVISEFSTEIMKGDRVGVLGPNGSGKTTLLRLLLGELHPDSGHIRLGTNLKVSYFSQLREQLDENKTVKENLVEKNQDSVTINGQKRHIIVYLRDFLFTPEQIRSNVSTLSGGERSRLVLARLLTRPSNLLVLDEPTNDLDIETMEILEEYLINYKGTVLLVSHDRAFINNVVTSTLVFEGGGKVKEYVGGYDDWLRQQAAETKQDKPEKAPPPSRRVRTKTKFGFNQQKELDSLAPAIHALEKEQAELFHAMGDPALYKNDASVVVLKQERLETVKRLLAESYARWEELENLKASCETNAG